MKHANLFKSFSDKICDEDVAAILDGTIGNFLYSIVLPYIADIMVGKHLTMIRRNIREKQHKEIRGIREGNE